MATTLDFISLGKFSNGAVANVTKGIIWRSANGSTQDLTNSVHWAITSGIATDSISQKGKFTPLAVGLGTVAATSGTVSGSTGFTVVHI